jgi:DNA-binding transcriptional regulator PaaX
MEKIGLLPKEREDEYINAARRRLKKRGLLVERDGFLRVSAKGEKHLHYLALALARPRPLKKWDWKWRILIFDVAEKRRGIRIALRRQLHAAGFRRVQDSIWAYPYPCEEFIALLKSELRVGKDLLYIVADAVEGDTRLRREFGLPDTDTPTLNVPPALDSILSAILPKKR